MSSDDEFDMLIPAGQRRSDRADGGKREKLDQLKKEMKSKGIDKKQANFLKLKELQKEVTKSVDDREEDKSAAGDFGTKTRREQEKQNVQDAQTKETPDAEVKSGQQQQKKKEEMIRSHEQTQNLG